MLVRMLRYPWYEWLPENASNSLGITLGTVNMVPSGMSSHLNEVLNAAAIAGVSAAALYFRVKSKMNEHSFAMGSMNTTACAHQLK